MFDTRLHDYWEPPTTERSVALIGRMRASWRAEARAAADRLDAIGELFEVRRAQRGEAADWAVDTWAAVGAEVAAAFRTSVAMAGSYLRYALAMRERLPAVAAVFRAGDIDYRLFQTLVYRTDLIEDAQVLSRVDAELAVRAPRWPSMTRGRLAGEIDRVIAAADPDAVRRNKERQVDRGVWIGDLVGCGVSEIQGGLLTPDAHALDQRLDALAASVCAQDPRTREQRRADALGALAVGAARLGCRCGRTDCAAGSRPVSPVVIHVIAEQATLDGGSAPASELGADELIPPELVAELAKSAKLVPLIHPGDAPPENGYIPSRALADFVRCRDLTCRAPGCDRPAIDCDIDHTIPYADGGATQASNLKCLCRFHHLVKTFWGWRDQQLPDGTVIWQLPGGQTYVTTPGSALLFPGVCAPTRPCHRGARSERRGEPSAMMPKRQRTRAQNRAARIATERRHNRAARRTDTWSYIGPAPPTGDDEPPPF
jgi:hypothetical protein